MGTPRFSHDRLSAKSRPKARQHLGPEHQLSSVQWKVFLDFVGASGRRIDLDSIEVTNSNSPLSPNVRCLVDGKSEWFQLAEVTDAEMKRISQAAIRLWLRQEHNDPGVFSPSQLLFRIFRKACRRRYVTHGMPVHLILYGSVDKQLFSHDRLYQDLDTWRASVVKTLTESDFIDVCLFDNLQKRVLGWQMRHGPRHDG